MKKVAIISERRSYLLNLASELDKSTDLDVILYTILPRKRCRSLGYHGRIISGFFPFAFLEVLVEWLPIHNPYKKSRLRTRTRILYDRFVSLQLKACDVVIGGNGCSVATSNVAHKRYNAIAICDQGSSHILAQEAAKKQYSDCQSSMLNIEYMLKHYDVADYLMAPSQYVLRTDLEHGISRDKILYNPLGVDTRLFHPTIKPSGDVYDVIMVGSWWKHKGCDMLLDACLNRLRISLLHVGSIIDCELPKSPLFKHIDFVPEAELVYYYSMARVFAMPSLDEGFGLVFSQAIACGLPIVGSTRTGAVDISSLLGNPSSCIIIDEPLSVDTITEALIRALKEAELQQPGVRDSFGSNLEKISWRAYGKRYHDIINSINSSITS